MEKAPTETTQLLWESRQIVEGKSGRWKSIAVVVAIGSVTTLTEGYDMGAISGALMLIQQRISMSDLQSGVLVGSLQFAMAVFAPVGGWLSDWQGRKRGLASAYVLLVVGPLLMAASVDFCQLLVGRIMMGAGCGMGLSIVSTYLAEVSPVESRGYMCGMEELFIAFGIVMGYIGNVGFDGVQGDWRFMLGIGAAPAAAVLIFVLTPWVPESPRWLLLHGRRSEAEAQLLEISGPHEAARVLREWDEQERVPAASWAEVCAPKDPCKRRALLCGMGVAVMNLACGIGLLTAYLGTIVREDIQDVHTAFLVEAVVGASRMLAVSVVIGCMLDSVGRRPMLLLSSSGMMVVSLVCIFVYSQIDISFGWKFASVSIFVIAHALGLGPACWPFISEVCDTDVRSKAISLMIFVARIVGGAMQVAFPCVLDKAGLPFIFAVLAAVNLGGFLFIAVYVPETKMHSLEEMHGVFDDVSQPGPELVG